MASLDTFGHHDQGRRLRIATDDEHQVYLTRNSTTGRSHDHRSRERCSEPDEEPLLTAKRELQEELGIEATTDGLGIVDPFTANVCHLPAYIAAS